MQKKGQKGQKGSDVCHLRIDPILVNKFKRLPNGVNEAGIKIVRDFGLKYAYNKEKDILDIIGDDPEILHIGIETLRFWIEEDDYPATGITCQVGYPNKGIVIWRFHGDYAKKFNHLFSDDITKLKKVPSLYVKAVPTKRNPEYVEVFCNFLVFQQVKGEIARISAELEKIFQADVFVPRSDFNKARNFALSKGRDEKVLYALKEYPENNKIRVWIFARDNAEVIKAKRDWIQHVGMIARDNKLVEEEKVHGIDMNSALFFGHPSSAITSERSSPAGKQKQENNSKEKEAEYYSPRKSNSNLKRKSTTDLLKTTQRGLKYDHSNYPRPPDFVYPINWDDTEKEFYKYPDVKPDNNPFNLEKMDNLSMIDEVGTHPKSQNVVAVNPMAGEARWVREDEIVNTGKRVPNKPGTNRIYVHLQVNANTLNPNVGKKTVNPIKVFHPEKNLIPISKLNAKNVISSVTDPTLAPEVKKGGKNVRPGGKKVGKKPVKIGGPTRVLKPVLQDQIPASNIRYQIKVNGLAIYMYKHFIVKLDNMDALVNSVSTSLKSGGLIAESMFDQAGHSVVDEIDVYLKMYGPLKIAQNIVTSAGRIPALGIIHVAAPVWEVYTNISVEECMKDLHKAIYDALKTAENHQYRKVGLPVLSAEPYFGVPRQIVADVYVKALVDYSLAMGPLFPVLEIHIVDMDVEMLTHIKDSYEKWASNPAFANMKTEFGSRENSVTSPTQLSHRAESAVSLKGARSHKSQNMVTFVEQAYTSEGNQIWTFEVLKKLLVHVYTGTLLSVDGVDGVVCGTDTNLKGNLAKQFLLHGGPDYERALKKARGKKEVNEGDVIVSEGGSLNADLVLHSIVASPIYRVSRKNLARLDNINNEVLNTANQLDIRTLALPLIGTARLREPFEVEQCSLQLVDNIIEFSLSMEKNLRIRELHLVNVNNITTQSLTQALRTRAHTKLRVEVPSHPPSRQEVLSTADGNKQISELHLQLPNSHGNLMDEKTKPSKITDKESFSGNQKNMDNSPGIEGITRNMHVQARKRIGYLSEKNLKEHERNLKESDRQPSVDKVTKLDDEYRKEGEKIDETGDTLAKGKPEHNIKVKPVPLIPKSRPKQEASQREIPSLHKEMEERAAPPPNLPKLDLGEFQKSSNAERMKRVKQRTPIRGPILQRSRAESYREIYDRRRSMVNQQRKEFIRLRRSRSIDNAMFSQENADKVFEMFRTERKKLQTLRAFNKRMYSDENEMDELIQKYSNYFTRGTRERYRINAGHNIDDKDFEMTYKLNPDTTINDMIPAPISHYQNKSKEHQISHFTDNADRNMNSRFKMVNRNREREEQYMMDMSYGITGTDDKTETLLHDKPDMDKSNDIDENFKGRPITDRSEKSRKERQERYEILTEVHQKKNTDSEGNQIPVQSKPVDKPIGDEPDQNPVLGENLETQNKTLGFGNELVRDGTIDVNEQKDDLYNGGDVSDKSSKLMAEFDKYVQETAYPNKEHIDAIAASFDQYVSDQTITETNRNKATVDKVKSNPVSKVKKPGEAIRLNKGQPAKRRPSKKQVGVMKKQPADLSLNKKLTKTMQSTTASLPAVDKEDEADLNDIYLETEMAPKPEDVTIRDKLTLEIGVVNRKDLDGEKLKKEKKKIRRFWEVVDNSRQEDKEIFGEEENEKVVVAKVKKERKMSARSKASKSNISSVTQPLGKYNVTVEVA